MIHRFNYPAFRSAFIRAKTVQRARATAEAQAHAYVTAITRPTEFNAELRLRLIRSRLQLTTLEKRVFHYDRLYMKRCKDGERSDYVTRERALYIASRAGCPSSQVARVLDHVEWLMWAADILNARVNTGYTHCARRCAPVRQQVR